jgi:tRNA(fMet)-specific endonuclease VapC
MILDTNAVSALLEGDSQIEKLLCNENQHEIPVIVIGEYRFGLLHSKHRKSIEPHFQKLIDACRVLEIDEETTLAYAQVRALLKKKGRPIPENDVWIAALAKQHQLAVISRNAHFKEVDGLRVHSW